MRLLQNFLGFSESSKSIHSNSGSSNSSGYGGLPATAEEFPQPHAAKSGSKAKDHKKKKCKTQDVAATGGDNKKIDEIAEVSCNEDLDVLHKSDGMTLDGMNSSSGDEVNSGSNSNSNSRSNNNNDNIINYGSNINSCEALHLATLAHTLSCIKRLKNTGIY